LRLLQALGSAYRAAADQLSGGGNVQHMKLEDYVESEKPACAKPMRPKSLKLMLASLTQARVADCPSGKLDRRWLRGDAPFAQDHPKHLYALKLMGQLYARLEDWQASLNSCCRAAVSHKLLASPLISRRWNIKVYNRLCSVKRRAAGKASGPGPQTNAVTAVCEPLPKPASKQRTLR